MLYPLLEPFRETLAIANLLSYLTVRGALAAAVALVLGIALGPAVIRLLTRWNIGQQVRGAGIPDLYERHKGKQGTPTMGGILILSCLLVAIVLFGDLTNRAVQIVVAVTVLMGVLGFLDDWKKLRRQQYKGVTKRGKILWQGAVALFVGWWLYAYPPHAVYYVTEQPDQEILGPPAPVRVQPGSVQLPFIKNTFIQLGPLYILLVALVIVGTTNAVNLTDGLDGLAAGCMIVATATYGVMAYLIGRSDFTRYLNVAYVPVAGELAVFCLALAGAAMAFLWYNCYPAHIFMGDTGSLAMGGALGTVAVMLRQELLLLLVGGIFAAEAVSVILQVISRKYFNDYRLFRMAPLHHHFELGGWKESQVIVRFWIVAIILGVLGLITLKVR